MKINYKPGSCNFRNIFFLSGVSLFSSLLIIILLPGCKPINNNSEEKRDRMLMVKNKVKTMKEFTSAVYVGVEAKEYISMETTFDRNGLRRKIVRYATDGSIESTIACDFDKNNNVVLMNGVNADGASFREVTSYDKNGNRFEVYHYLPDGTYKFKNTSICDNNGRVIEVHWYGTEKLRAKVFYVYDGENKIEETEYSPKGELCYTWKYKYDANNNLVEAVQSKPDNAVMKKITYVFGNDNQLVKKISYSGEGIENSKTFECDKKGLLSSQSEFNRFGKVYAKRRYQYEYFQ